MVTVRRSIDPLEGAKLVLAGDLVTMNGRFRVIRDGRLYVDRGNVVAATTKTARPPAGFSGVPVTQTNGTLYPGLIELHNHLAYNALPLWEVPKRYSNRNQWGGTPEYRKRVTGPMTILGDSPDLLPALIRYVEAKCVLGGTTTSQGIQLFSNQGIRRFYRGIVRNVEQTDEAALPEAVTKIADVEAADAAAFFERLKKQTCMLLHLSEGVDGAARKHFTVLEVAPDTWAITPALAGIHAAGLEPADMKVFGAHGGAMIWSPLSNLLLYGDTADMAAAKAARVRIGIGSDWSVSGSKNLLGELKVALLWSATNGVFTPREIVAMATRTAAAILGWHAALGSLEPGKRADVLVIDGTAKDVYTHLIEARELDVALVLINGVPRYGRPDLMDALGAGGEAVAVGGAARRLFLEQRTADPLVANVSLAKATALLKAALADLPRLARELEKPRPRAALRAIGPAAPVWRLALDELHDTGVDLRHHLARSAGVPAMRAIPRASRPLSQIVAPIELDPLTVVDDPDFFDVMDRQRNLPAYVKTGLRALYGAG